MAKVQKRVYLMGAEGDKWALETDAALLEQALKPFAKVVRFPWEANVFHSVAPQITYQYIRTAKNFIAAFPGDPDRLFRDKNFYEFCKSTICVAQSKLAYTKLKRYGIPNVEYIPYIADLINYRQIENREEIREQLGIEKKQFVIGNFMRDTIAMDLKSPKMEKGPDIFCDIVERFVKDSDSQQIVVLLAGPRRQWIREELRKRNIKYIYVGKNVKEGNDDFVINKLSADKINELINCCNIIIVSSRSEGGPRAILEAGAAQVPIISTNVGIAADVLPEECIFTNIDEAVEKIKSEYDSHKISTYIETIYKTILEECSIEQVSKRYNELYSKINEKVMIGNSIYYLQSLFCKKMKVYLWKIKGKR